MEKRVVICTAMHGRQDTVRYCYEKMKHLPVEFMYGYTNISDGEFLQDMLDSGVTYRVANQPLFNKFQVGIDLLKQLTFDVAIMLGSDDYIDEKFLDYVCKQAEKYDFIGFKDIYFEQGEKTYYWSGYTNHREGEPSGAGKTYTREGLEQLNWNLYNNSINRGLDGSSWQRVKRFKLLSKIASVKREGLKLVDVKDKGSLTPLVKFRPNELELVEVLG